MDQIIYETHTRVANNKVVVNTNDPRILPFLTVQREEKGYSPFLHRLSMVKKTYKIYEKRPKTTNGITTYEFGLGWVSYLARLLKNLIPIDEYNNLISSLYSTNVRTEPFPELRDYQNEDVLFMLKYKRAVCSVYTSYGKTQVIATLANYAHSIGKRVLIVAPGKKPLDELIKRCKSAFNLDIPNSDLSINAMITGGVMNSKNKTDKDQAKEFSNLLSSYDWVLVDEVEYCINPGGCYIFDRCTGAEVMYAFSGTAEKKKAQMISFNNGLNDDCVIDNISLVKYFGPSLVYRSPQTLQIRNIAITTSAFDSLVFPKEMFNNAESNVYSNVMNTIWTNDGVINVIESVIKKFPKLFIPVNNLTTILSTWINKWIGKFNMLLVCGEGYIHYNLEGTRYINLTLTEACELIKRGNVDVILSTSAGYRALDFPGLTNILLIQGNIAGVVLQCVGRVARGKESNIISLIPENPNTRIPIYSKGLDARIDMIKDYYKYCPQEDIVITENDLITH
jgi:hypothetical protein